MRDASLKHTSLLVSGIACAAALAGEAANPTGMGQAVGIAALLAFSLFIRAAGNRPQAVGIALAAKTVATLLVGIPMLPGEGTEETLLFSLAFECLAYLPEVPGAALALFAFVVSCMGQGEWKTLTGVVRAATVAEAFSYAIRLAILFLLASALKKRHGESVALASRLDHLERAATGVAEANLDMQAWALGAELRTAESERRRITREIHDVLGYSLTNQLMSLEAGILLIDRDPARVRTMLEDARDQLRDGLEDIRKALRDMRETETVDESPYSRLRKLVDVFGESTGVAIELRYELPPGSLPPDVFHCAYRLIQQGLTNAIFHGKPETVRVTLSRGDREIVILVEDDGGKGRNADIREGIGLSGIRERLEPFGGRLSYRQGEDGFTLSARIPIAKEADAP